MDPLQFADKSPHAGDWIETNRVPVMHRPMQVPSRRGLDRNMYNFFVVRITNKSPHAGDWIETHLRGLLSCCSKVPSRRGLNRNMEIPSDLAASGSPHTQGTG